MAMEFPMSDKPEIKICCYMLNQMHNYITLYYIYIYYIVIFLLYNVKYAAICCNYCLFGYSVAKGKRAWISLDVPPRHPSVSICVCSAGLSQPDAPPVWLFSCVPISRHHVHPSSDHLWSLQSL